MVAPWKFDVLRASIFALETLHLWQIFVLRTSNFHGATISGYFLNRNTLTIILKIVALQKFDVLKTNICPRSEFSNANLLVLRTSNFQGDNYQNDSSKTKTTYCLKC